MNTPHRHPGDIRAADGTLIGRKDMSDRDLLAPLIGPADRAALVADALAWAETFLARHDAFLQSQTPQLAHMMSDAADGLREALARLHATEGDA